MNKTYFFAEWRFYEHPYEHSSLIYQSRRSEDIKGIYKYYICHYNFLPMQTYLSWKFLLLSDHLPCCAGGPAIYHSCKNNNRSSLPCSLRWRPSHCCQTFHSVSFPTPHHCIDDFPSSVIFHLHLHFCFQLIPSLR